MSTEERKAGRDDFNAETERTKFREVISIQPPGTTGSGLAFPRACIAPGDRSFLEAATAAGEVLLP